MNNASKDNDNTRISGIIYKVTNKVNGKIYIGMTVNDFEKRKRDHIAMAKRGDERNRYFQNAINKYGEDSFSWEIIDTDISQENLDEKEIYWISHYNSFGEGGYNLTEGGGGVSGYKWSEEAKKDASRRLKGKYSGENSPKTTLTNQEVLEIKDLLIYGKGLDFISDAYNISNNAIRSIRNGYTWKSLISDEDVAKMQKASTFLTVEEVKSVRDLLINTDMSVLDISSKMKIKNSQVHSILKGVAWKSIISEDDVVKMNKRERDGDREKIALKAKHLLLNSDMSQAEIARHLGESDDFVSGIKNGRNYAYLSTENELKTLKSRANQRKTTNLSKEFQKLTIDEDAVNLIKKHLKEGRLSPTEIAKTLNTFSSIVRNIRDGKTWKKLLSDGELEEMRCYEDKKIQNLNRAKSLLLEGVGRVEIAKITSLSASVISKIARGKHSKIKSSESEIDKMSERQ